MSVLDLENFQYYGVTANMLGGTPWANIFTGSGGGLDSDPDGVSPGQVLRVRSSSVLSSVDRYVVPVPGQQIGVAARWWFSSLPPSSPQSACMAFKTAGNQHIALVYITPTGQIVWANAIAAGNETNNFANFVTVATSATLDFTPGTWNHLGLFLDTASGDFEVWLEGDLILDGNDPAAGGGTIGMLEWRDKITEGALHGDMYLKDLIPWDTNGSVGNTFPGPLTIYSRVVDGDVSSGWTPSTGTEDYPLLNNLNPNDTTYIEAAATLPAPSIMTFENLPPDIVRVAALKTIVRAGKTDGGDANMQVGLISNGMLDTGGDDTVQVSFDYHWDISELDPNTGLPWAPPAVDAADIQINRTL